MEHNCEPTHRIVNTEGRVLLATSSAYTAVRLAVTSKVFAGNVQILVFGEWVNLDQAAELN